MDLNLEQTILEQEQFGNLQTSELQTDEWGVPTAQTAQTAIRFEAEDLNLDGYQVENFPDSEVSGEQLISLRGRDERTGTADGIFTGTTGFYQIEVGYYDENDGISDASVTVANETSAFKFEQNTGGDRVSPQTFSSKVTHESVYLESGDRFEIEASSDGNEFARFDYLDFKLVEAADDSQSLEDASSLEALDSQSLEDISDTDTDTDTDTEDSQSTLDSDPNYPVINEFAKAGVEGGIPNNQEIVITINPGDNIQAAIDDANASGGGVVMLNSGTYKINSTIDFQDNVILRGESRDSVILESTIRSTWNEGKKDTFVFDDDRYSGIEDLTIDYKVPNFTPEDGEGLEEERNGDYFTNNPNGRNDLYVRQINIRENSSNNWVDNVSILNSGTDPILVRGDHNTLSNNLVDRVYNKGTDGNGYYSITGDYNLIDGETVKRIRHFAVQRGAEYNVITNSEFEVDINFHNGDDGNNLVESNTINLPNWHGWEIFTTGGPQFGHSKPGKNNILVNNTTYNYRQNTSPFSEPDVIYTYDGYGDPVATNWAMPNSNKFYSG